MTRRTLTNTAVSFTALSYARVLGANDRVQLGLIGAGNRGQYVMSLFQKEPVQVSAVCDVYGARIDEALTKAPDAKGFRDHHKLLELKQIDAVLIGTPDHWHAGTAIDAVNAGKDVYCEKPLTRLKEEGPAIVRAARVNERVFQVGTQQRSGRVYLEAKERYFDSGMIGKISHVRSVWNNTPPRKLDYPKFAEKPSNLDWATFLGPVKWREWMPAQYLNFRAFLDFGGGKMTDFGAHWIDVIHMFLNQDAPLAVMASGGIYFDYQDGRTAPDCISALFDYTGYTVQFESLAVGNPGEYGIDFYGSNGRLFINRNRYEYHPAAKGAQPTIEKFPGDITADHVRNFLECCRTRKRPNADVYIGHRSCQATLLAVESYQRKRRIRFDGEREVSS